MAADFRELPRAESERRVAVDVDLGDLARAAELLQAPRIIEKGGFTIDELAAHTGRSRTTTERHVKAMIRAGKYERVGRRPGCGAQVYRVLD